MARRKKFPHLPPSADENPMIGYLTLGGTKPYYVMQEDDTWPPYAEILASRVCRHDPRMDYEREQVAQSLDLRAFAPTIYPGRAGQKYCACCGEWVSINGFSPDPRNRDGLHSHCKTCRNEHRRRMYSLRRVGVRA